MFPHQLSKGQAGDLRVVSVARELRKLGWRAIVVPPWASLGDRLLLERVLKPDVILLQQTRDKFNDPNFYKHTPCVLDVDDADFIKTQTRVGDICRTSKAVIAGNRFLAREFATYNANTSVIWTGTYLKRSRTAIPNGDRASIVTWAPSHPTSYTEEMAFLLEMLPTLAAKISFTFVMYGTAASASAATSFVESLKKAGVHVIGQPAMTYHHFVKSLEVAAVGLHPISPLNPFSQGKSFGKLLAYMVAGVAVVTSNAVDHPLFFRHGESALLLGDDIDVWVDGCTELLRNPISRNAMAERAYLDMLERLTPVRAAQLLHPILLDVATNYAHQRLPSYRTRVK
jgi:hypothetical protein